MANNAGPKAAALEEPLDWKPRSEGVRRFELFCERFLRVPKGVGAGDAFRLRQWQAEMCRDLFEGDHKINVWMLPRGQGKSALTAAIALYWLFMGQRGERIAVIAQNDRSASRLLATAKSMVQLHPELAERAQIYKDKIRVPFLDAEFIAVASSQAAIEGEDLSLAIVDEIGFTLYEVYEATLLSLSKRPNTRMVCIGTPSTPAMMEKSPLRDLYDQAKAGDEFINLVEYSAPKDLPIDDPATWAMANPALGDWLDAKDIKGDLPPRTREWEFRRARLGQWVEQSGESYLPADAWKACARDGVKIPKGTPVVIGLDGSSHWDATCLVMASVSDKPHLQVAGFWFGNHKKGYQVSHAEVEQRILDLCDEYRVLEVIADPHLWQRSLQVLEDQGVNVAQFPQHGKRMPMALAEFRAAALDKKLTHENDKRLNRHMFNAQAKEGNFGVKLEKPGDRHHIDLAVASIMAYSRANWLARPNTKKKRFRSY